MYTKIEYIAPLNTSIDEINSDETAKILSRFDLKYDISNYYFQVGDITRTQGWIIHLSVVISQAIKLVELIIAFLSTEKIAFKVARKSAFEDILIGNLGVAQIGKIICIYPDSDLIAVQLVRRLLGLTESFKGPFIPTDLCLGNIVYTRYGSFNPIVKADEKGNLEKYIFDGTGTLVKDAYHIPFEIPKGVVWPFQEIKNQDLPEKPKLLDRTYKILDILKVDPRGNVYKGLYLKSLFQVKTCVLKQGIKYSTSDYAGRDIQDRLNWQAELYKRISDTVSMPAIYDLIKEDYYTLLVMEYINGPSLYQKIQDINPECKCWNDLSTDQSLKILHYGIELSKMLERLHKIGYVHRDIVPVNFLIGKKNKLVLIDVELMYCLSESIPHPPFVLGTPGFMSPEQQSIEKPTKEQDVYSLGATLLYLFTGLTPIKFNKTDTNALSRSLVAFTSNRDISELIANTLSPNPTIRPTLNSICHTLQKYQLDLAKTPSKKPISTTKTPEVVALNDTIYCAIRGLTKAPIVSDNCLWLSKKITPENYSAPVQKEYTKLVGLARGMSGPLYLLARLHKAKFNIEPCIQRFFAGWEFINNYLFQNFTILPGLYKGTAGIALALSEGIKSGLLEKNDTYTETISRLLSIEAETSDLAYGLAGQGVSILRCENVFSKKHSQPLLDHIISRLLDRWDKNGSWIESIDSSNSFISTNIYDIKYDSTGILWFLLDYISLYPNGVVQNLVENSLHKLLSKKQLMKTFDNLSATRESYDRGDGGKGLVLVLIKAYQTLKDNRYKCLAERTLSKYPPSIIHSNFSQQSGLAGIGEVFLEAWSVFENEKWKMHADHIANTFLNIFYKTADDAGHWVMEEYCPPTADLMSGVSGIIHFLARCISPSQLKYRILS